MNFDLAVPQNEIITKARSFAKREIAPYANGYDNAELIPHELIDKIADSGFLSLITPKKYGGLEIDTLTYGLVHEEIGSACSSVRSLLTVHDMVTCALTRWGSIEQKEKFLARMITGNIISAFALSEPSIGSDAGNVETTAFLTGEGFVINGHKKWISFGQIAKLFLVFAKCEGMITAFLVERDTVGLTINPIRGMLGLRASMLAELKFENCVVPEHNVIGRVGFGFSHVASSSLTLGRYSVACGCVGLMKACVESCLQYTSERRQFGVQLREHQLIREMITNMVVNLKASKSLCRYVGSLIENNDPDSLAEASIAKYFASTSAMKTASDAVQIHGANGCSSDYPVQRYLRDAKIMEIIEGSSQIQQLYIAKNIYQQFQSLEGISL